MISWRNNMLGIILCASVICLQLQVVTAYDQATCCELAKSENQFIGLIPEVQICGQTYNASTPAAEPLFVTWRFCSTRCRGIHLSKAGEAKQWAASIVQFILPSVIFSMTIPRRKKIEFDYLFDFAWPRTLTRWGWLNEVVGLLVSACCFTVILVPVVLDTIIWIAVIVCGAGNMIVGGLYEGHLDWRICRFVREWRGGEEEDLVMKRELLVTITSGNLMLEKGNPQQAIPQSLTTPGSEPPQDGFEKGRSRLLNLLGAQTSFGSAVGSPVLFYMGAFVYSILDLRNDPSNEDSAESLGFGMEWMIIVHVAMISGCLLASNNPSTSAGIVGAGHQALEHRARGFQRTSTIPRGDGDPPEMTSRWYRFTHLILGWSNTYDTEFQPVSLSARGSNKMKWIQRSAAYKKKEFRDAVTITRLGWIFKILVPSLILIVLPPAAGGVVAFFTPPRGIGCRSLSFITYAACQVVCTVLATIRCTVDDGSSGLFLQTLFSGWRFRTLSLLFWFGSLVAAVGGTTMQIVGVYRNCICYAGAKNWWNINEINPTINLATDTQDGRDSSVYWIWMGSVATVFMALNCYFGWWYQRLVRRRFTDAVKEMYSPSRIEGIPLRTLSPEGRSSSEGKETLADRDSISSSMPLLQRQESAHSWAEAAAEALDPAKLSPRLSPSMDHRGKEGEASGVQRPVFRIEVGMGGGGNGMLSPLPAERRPRPRADS